MMEAVNTSETSVNCDKITRRNNPEDSHLQDEYQWKNQMERVWKI
jgi:hypothetical protein